jgi:Holliday junction resolvase-like predicted endonuclease
MTDQELKDLVASLAVAQVENLKGFAELRASQAKTEEILKAHTVALAAAQAKTDAQMAKTDAQMAKTDAQMAKTDAQMAKTDAKYASTLEMLTGITTSQGLVSEEFFYNTLADTLCVAGIKYDSITSNIKHKVNGKWMEVDLLLENGSSLAIIEVKYRARNSNIEQLKNTIKNYREAFPQHKQFKIYAGIASFSIDEFVATQAHAQGFFILKRKGDLLEVDTQGMRSF